MASAISQRLEESVSGTPKSPVRVPTPIRDPYRAVVFVLLAAALLATSAAIAGGILLASGVLLAAAVTLGMATGVLVGVAVAQAARARPPKREKEIETLAGAEQEETAAAESAEAKSPAIRFHPKPAFDRTRQWLADLEELEVIRVVTVAAGVFGVILLLMANLFPLPMRPITAAIAAAACLCGAGLAATAARYLVAIPPSEFPEAPGLCRGARVVAWVLVLAALSMGLTWADQQILLRVSFVAILMVNAALCYGLLVVRRPEEPAPQSFPLDLVVLTVLGSRPNIAASVLDTAERQLGIDLRSTWALTVVRRSLEPLAIGLCLVAWLSTSLTVIGVEQQGLVEHWGVPVAGAPLEPGLHLHWPWPVDQVFRIPVRRVQSLTIGHEGQEAGGPENVLWARQHAANEFTLVLGNGRDLITVDAAVHFRITDARAWRYHTQNPAQALSALGYRAVMRNTVNRTLADALSENMVTLTNTMREQIQQEADALGLGVEIVGFTVGGMHPPVPVASDYQAVVSAELGKVTAAVDAQVYRNQIVPSSEASVLASTNGARADAAKSLAVAAGEAWSFRTLESQYHAEPQDYLFRRRLETLENNLAGRHFTIVDTRFQRDGGEIWLIP
jgi:regulator of protease activity HflC (stomatin/prohibitin superfamily)